MDNKTFKNLLNENSEFIAFKALSNQIPNVSIFCNDHCVKGYKTSFLNQDELICLEKCSNEILNFNSFLFSNVKLN